MKSKKSNQLFPFSWRDLFVSIGILSCAAELCILLHMVEPSGEFASLIFVLAVLLVSRLTTGYLFGLVSSIVGVICVNYVFTYPYMQINFTIAGYPLTFLIMLVVSIITCTMTTQIKQQERLRVENEREKMRANLLRSVSHDIRTPLTSIIGSISTVLENENTLSPEDTRSLLSDAREDAQWLIRLVENLLSVTRIGEDRTQIRKETEAAEEVLDEVVRKFRKRFPTISVQVSIPDDLLFVPMDAILIEQVLSNLMENSVLHGGSTSKIQLAVCVDGHDACFTVRDDGDGIAPQELPTLFNGLLKQSDQREIDGKRNMGLGLTVCMAIIRAHGGSMQARNLPIRGAELSFRLPLEEEEST